MSVQGHAPFVPVQTGKPTELDLSEPPRVADAVAKMGLQHCVLTSVARDDRDGGASLGRHDPCRSDIVTLRRQLKCSFLTSRVV